MIKKIVKFLKSHTPIIIFCFFYIVFALTTYKDFGITTDEEREYAAGGLLGDLVLNKKPSEYFYSSPGHINPYMSPYLRTHVAIFSLLNVQNSYEVFHLLNLLFGLAIFIVVYAFLYEITDKNSFYSILGPIILFFIPRYLGHIPANPKDIPFSLFYLLGIYLIYKFYLVKNNPTLINLTFLGFFIGIAQSSRLVGMSLFIVAMVSIFINYLASKDKKNLLKNILGIFFVLEVSVVTMFILLPYLWLDPANRLVNLVINSSSFNNWDNTILFMGNLLTKNQRPDIYLPVWFLITTPIYIMILGLYSLVKLKYFFKKPVWLVLVFTLALNFAAYFIVKPVVYNGLRHFLYFIPIIAILSSLALIKLLEEMRSTKSLIGKAIFIITLTFFAITINKTYKFHPYQYIYFNELAGGLEGSVQKFEVDYWGATYSEAAKWLEQNKNSLIKNGESKKVYFCTMDEVPKYYLSGSYEVVGSPQKSELAVCDIDRIAKRKLGLKSIYQIKREGTIILHIGHVL